MPMITLDLDTVAYQILQNTTQSKGVSPSEWVSQLIKSHQPVVSTTATAINQADLDKALLACGFGTLEGRGGVTFADDWYMTDDELLNH